MLRGTTLRIVTHMRIAFEYNRIKAIRKLCKVGLHARFEMTGDGIANSKEAIARWNLKGRDYSILSKKMWKK